MELADSCSSGSYPLVPWSPDPLTLALSDIRFALIICVVRTAIVLSHFWLLEAIRVVLLVAWKWVIFNIACSESLSGKLSDLFYYRVPLVLLTRARVWHVTCVYFCGVNWRNWNHLANKWRMLTYLTAPKWYFGLDTIKSIDELFITSNLLLKLHLQLTYSVLKKWLHRFWIFK